MRKINLFYYDDSKLNFIRVKFRYIIYIVLSLITLFTVLLKLSCSEQYDILNLNDYESNMMVINVNDTIHDFTEDKLVDMLISLNVKFPHIVLAQARLESGNYTSKVFKENNNLFGMKEARVRINTAVGTQYNHACYEHWRESVYDYAFYQSTYLYRLKTEKEYFTYLDQSYAEAPNYVITLKNMINNDGIKELFDGH